MWKAFHYSPKKAEKLAEIEAVLKIPELKTLKPSDTRWLAQEQCVCAVRQTLPAIVATFEAIYEESGHAEAYGIAKLMCTYKFVACLCMLCDILHTVAKLQGSLQAKELDLVTVPVMVKGTLTRLVELKEHPGSSTWSKDQTAVFSDQAALGNRNIVVSQADEDNFSAKVYRPYIQSVVDHITSQLKSSDVFSAFAIFNPSHLPKTEDSLPLYSEEKLQILTNFYGTPQSVTFKRQTKLSVPDLDEQQTVAQWKIFRRILFTNYSESSCSDVLANLLTNHTLKAGFPNLECLASICVVLPVTTATPVADQ